MPKAVVHRRNGGAGMERELSLVLESNELKETLIFPILVFGIYAFIATKLFFSTFSCCALRQSRCSRPSVDATLKRWAPYRSQAAPVCLDTDGHIDSGARTFKHGFTPTAG